MQKLLLLIVGGAIGTTARYALSGYVHKFTGINFPYGTLLVNISGAFIIGCIWAVFEQTNFSSSMRTFLMIGVLGSYTTFSTFMLESMNLFEDGEIRLGLLNILLNNMLGIVFVFAGFWLVKSVLQLMR